MWHCGACGQDWTASIKSRTRAQRGCPHCFNQKRKGKRQRQPPVADNEHAMKYWHWANNQEAGLDPHKLTWGSNRRANWICHQCRKGQPHRWTAVVHTVCMTTTGCPSCLGQKACICNSLQSLHPEIAAEWDSSRNEATPDDYSAQSNKKVWWCTSKRGSFHAAITDRTRYKKKLDRCVLSFAVWHNTSCSDRQHRAYDVHKHAEHRVSSTA